MTIQQNAVDRLLFLVGTRYPDWSGFDDPRYLEEEVEYKEASIQLANELLAEEEIQHLIAAENFEEIIARLDTVGKENNLLWRNVPTAGDLNILYEENLDQESFSQAILDLLYGDGSPPELIQAYSDFIDNRGWPNKWTFPTYFRFLLHPETDFFVKPRATKWYLKTLGSDVKLGNDPDGKVYHEILQKTGELKEHLEEFRPENMVDIQSLLWTAYRTGQELEEELSDPFSILFSDRREAEWAFDFLMESADRLGVQGPDDPLAPFTLRQAGKKYLLRMIYGNWLMIGFSAIEDESRSIALALVDHPDDIEYTDKQDFVVKEGEIQISIYWFDFMDVYQNKEAFQKILEDSQELIRPRFAHWKASPFRNYQVDLVADAVFDIQKREQLLKLGVKPLQQCFWKISPGANAWNWENCLQGNYIAVGWEALGDLSGVSREEFEIRRTRHIEQYPDTSEEALEQVWKFAQIMDGDRVVANRGTKEVLGIGTVTGAYYFEEGSRHSHRLPVEWDEVGLRKVEEPGWRRTLIELNEDKFEAIKEKPIEAQADEGESPFSEKTFELLRGIHDNSTKEFYDQHKEDFIDYVKTPFKDLMQEVAERLPAPIRDQMETKKRLFSRFLKNDFGQGGAWSHYWGAFYPVGGKRTAGSQLSLWLDYSRLEAGFFIGDYGTEQRERFTRNCQQYYQSLVSLLKGTLASEEVIFGPHHRESAELEEYGEEEYLDWKKWLKNPGEWEYDVSVIFPKFLVLSISREELIERIVEIYTNLFPLVLLAISDDPLPLIRDYLGVDREEREINPGYSLEECSQETNFDLELLKRWVRAIDRKKQGIFYGPPGTGKTYVAEKLAKHLIGGGDGFMDLVQFHPAYAYEDFIQGIRPKPLPGGGLSYPIVPGRFLEFCNQARLRSGICVLIVDEINRANLARVFGELMYLLEYRDKQIPLAGGKKFSIPENVRIIGTMNTADRSIALVDHALRRRFAFLGLYPNYTVLEKYHETNGTGYDLEGLISVLQDLNLQISDRNYYVGITYFLREDLSDQIEDIWRMEIEPYLEEYFFDQQEKVKEFRWEKVADNIQG